MTILSKPKLQDDKGSDQGKNTNPAKKKAIRYYISTFLIRQENVQRERVTLQSLDMTARDNPRHIEGSKTQCFESKGRVL